MMKIKNKKITFAIIFLIFAVFLIATGCVRNVAPSNVGVADDIDINKVLFCSLNSDCATKQVGERQVSTGARIIHIPLYVCVNKNYINSELITHDWALRNNVAVSDMLEQECSCSDSVCGIFPTGINPPPK